MNAIASLEEQPFRGSVADARCVLRINGVPLPDAQVARYEARAPLDTRTVDLRVSGRLARERLQLRRAAQHMDVCLPVRLSGGEPKWLPLLFEGYLIDDQQGRNALGDAQQVQLIDPWTKQTQSPLEQAWALRDGQLVALPLQGQRVLLGGASLGGWGMSTQAYDINGQSVHVMDRNGEDWTVREALRSLLVFCGWSISALVLPRAAEASAPSELLDLRRPLGELLTELLELYPVVFQQTDTRALALLPEGVNTHEISRTRQGVVSGPLQRMVETNPAGQAALLIAEADGELVESTFEMVGGWDPSQEGLASTEYGRGTSTDFAAVASVYRDWVLNEDGAFSGAPFQRGDAFDLASLFDVPFVPPQPLRFERPLVLGSGGGRRDLLVQYSTNAGSSWQEYPGAYDLRTDRAGITLTDATLPTDYLTAALSGQARLRVTATLQSPLPVEQRQWVGNPFAPGFETIRLDVSNLFAYQRVDLNSVHAADVAAEVLDADLRKDTAAHRDWLLAEADVRKRQSRETLELQLTGFWPGLTTGSRVNSFDGPLVQDLGVVQRVSTRRVDDAYTTTLYTQR